MTLRSKLELSRRQFGDLDCTLIVPAEAQTPEFCVVLCHGFGAPGSDLVPLGQELAALTPELLGKTAYLFPEAPLELGGYGFPGRAWWMVDVERFQRAAGNSREMAALRAEVPPGMSESSQALRSCLEDALRQISVPLSRTLLGGFSQGSMVATDVALRLPTPACRLVCLFRAPAGRIRMAAVGQKSRVFGRTADSRQVRPAAAFRGGGGPPRHADRVGAVGRVRGL